MLLTNICATTLYFIIISKAYIRYWRNGQGLDSEHFILVAVQAIFWHLNDSVFLVGDLY